MSTFPLYTLIRHVLVCALKDVFGSERRKAKTLNFSIAYGKTVHGLSKDWGVTVGEARAMLDAWYADRPEVREWQAQTIATAHRTGATRTLMGRYRKLPDIGGTRAQSAHSERAAINTPIQGGAADVMTLAMLKLKRSPVLKELGYTLILQIHDEVIMEVRPDAARRLPVPFPRWRHIVCDPCLARAVSPCVGAWLCRRVRGRVCGRVVAASAAAAARAYAWRAFSPSFVPCPWRPGARGARSGRQGRGGRVHGQPFRRGAAVAQGGPRRRCEDGQELVRGQVERDATRHRSLQDGSPLTVVCQSLLRLDDLVLMACFAHFVHEKQERVFE